MPVRFLADEDCDSLVVRALRTAGHDVLAVRELSPRILYRIAAQAMEHGADLLTSDRHFEKISGLAFTTF